MHFKKNGSNDFGKFYCTNSFETLIASISYSVLVGPSMVVYDPKLKQSKNSKSDLITFVLYSLAFGVRKKYGASPVVV